MSEKQAIVEMLNADLRDEHAAVVQYLQHAYAIGEGEAFAREEMRHLDWLAEELAELGGHPPIAHTEMALD